MDSNVPGPPPAGGATAPRAEETPAGAGAGPPVGRLLMAAAAAGLLAGVIGFGIGEAAIDRLTPGFQMAEETRTNTEASATETLRQLEQAKTLSASASYGALAAVLGLSLAIAGGIAGRSRSRIVPAALLGAVLGGLATAASSYGLSEVFREIFRTSPANYSKDMLTPLLLHGGMWLPAGLFGGLAFGLALGGRGRAAQAAFGGCLGAVAAVLLYEIGGALAFPTEKTTHPVAASMAPRMMAHLSVALLVSLAAAWSIAGLKAARPKPS